MPKYESDFHTKEMSPGPWKAEDTMLMDANGAMIANFEVRHTTLGLLQGAYDNCKFAADAMNAYHKRAGADIRQLQKRVKDWADRQFPNRTTADVLLKLYEELGEYARDPKSEPELGDIMILLLDAAAMNGIDIQRAVSEKMDVNEKRQWKVDENTRIMRHV